MKKTVEDFINEELREYAVYDNSRSIPNIADGLKTSQRKVIHTVFSELKKDNWIKVASLGPLASSKTHYKHGEISITDTVVGLAQDHAGSNNYPLLEKDGQFGNSQDYSSSSTRYIYVARGESLDKMFNNFDREIINYMTYDGDNIEPEYFLPKLPLILINGTKGIGNGYSTDITQRDTKNVANYIKQYIINAPLDKSLLLPSYKGFNGTVEETGVASFLIKGKIERVNTTTTIIKDLPPTSLYQYEKYKERVLLPLLEDKSSGLNDIENESTENNWYIILKHTREFANCSDDTLLEKLKMVSKCTENITVWGFDNKLKIFRDVYELMDYWIENRLGWIQKRKDHILSKIETKNAVNISLLKLIEYWLENDNLSKMKKDELFALLETVVDNKEHINKFFDLNIMSLTKERVDKLKNDIKTLIKEYKNIKSKNIVDIYLDDINEFC